MASTFDMLKGKVVNKGVEVDLDAVIKDKYVMLYFSAHWCPPCRGFTPNLVQFYETNNASKNFEIIFISHDRDETSFNEYYGQMPYLAVKFNESELRKELAAKFGVRGIPCLLLLDKDGTIMNQNAREKVASDPNAAQFPWTC